MSNLLQAYGESIDPSLGDPQPPRPIDLIRSLEEEEKETRLRESTAISDRYQEELTKRGSTSSMSPEWVAAQPKSLKERLRVTPQEEEDILFHYASTASIPKTASLAGVGVDKVRSVVFAPDVQSRLSDLRAAMGMSIIRKIEETQTILLDALQNPDKLADSSITQISTVLREISDNHRNLLAASQSGNSFQEVDPTEVYTGDELEYMAFLSRRLRLSGSQRTELPSGGEGGPTPDSDGLGKTADRLDLDNFIEPNFVVSPEVGEIDPGDSVESTLEDLDRPRGLDPEADAAEFPAEEVAEIHQIVDEIMKDEV